MNALNDTANRVLDVAEHFTQTRGFNAFSYKDLQKEVGVKTSSIHYYFPTKQDLALTMAERYIAAFDSQLQQITRQESSPVERLKKLGEIYVSVVKDGKFCLCGTLASDCLSMPESVNKRVNEFFVSTHAWIASNIQEMQPKADSNALSEQFIALLEGGMLIARARKQPEYLTALVTHFVDQQLG